MHTYSRNKQIKEIISNLKRSSLLGLSSEDICFFVNYRIEELLLKHDVLSFYDIRYNLCEVGPWGRRLDPLALKIVINSSRFQKHSSFEITTKNRLEYITRAKIVLPDREVAIRAQQTIIDNMHQYAKSDYVLSAITEILVNTCQANDYRILRTEINQEDGYSECLVRADRFNNATLLIRYYNSENWIYPDSKEISSIYNKAVTNDCMPILLAPKIFGSCFQLFKILGMFARANYYIFLPCNYTEKISFVRHEYVSERTEDHQLIELNDLLENVIPKYLIAFKEKHNHVSSEACSIFMCDNHELSVECCDLSQRLEGLSAFLRQLKSTKIDGLRNIVKKWLSLFNDLNK